MDFLQLFLVGDQGRAVRAGPGVPPGSAEEETMKKPHLSRGWTQRRLRELAQYHDHLTEEEQAAEIETSLAQKGQTVLVVPTKFVPEILRIIDPNGSA
jgi:hypothetical protein